MGEESVNVYVPAVRYFIPCVSQVAPVGQPQPPPMGIPVGQVYWHVLAAAAGSAKLAVRPWAGTPVTLYEVPPLAYAPPDGSPVQAPFMVYVPDEVPASVPPAGRNADCMEAFTSCGGLLEESRSAILCVEAADPV